MTLDVRAASALAALAATLALNPCTAQIGPVSPADRLSLEGSSSSSYPLGRADCRLQQVHADLGAARSLNGHAYRRDALSQSGQVAAFQSDLEVTVSICPNSPDQLSSNFDNNLGGAPQLVLPLTRMSFPATTRPGMDPAPGFALRIPWQTPFAYPGNAPLCVDVRVHGNSTSRGDDRNFTAYLDAHQQYADGRNIQPAYRYGSGCPAPGATRSHSARLGVTTFGDGSMQLDLDSRDGVPSLPGNDAHTALILGLGTLNIPLPTATSCVFQTSGDSLLLLDGANDAGGAWKGALPVVDQVPAGFRILAQLASGSIGGSLTLSDVNQLTVPPPGPAAVTAARVSSASDHSAATGTVSTTVTVTEFF